MKYILIIALAVSTASCATMKHNAGAAAGRWDRTQFQLPADSITDAGDHKLAWVDEKAYRVIYREPKK